MATQNPMMQPGSWVQFNVSTQSPRSPLPDAAESTIGIVRQAFTKADGAYYQVVWNPGSATPETALYHESQLCQLTPQQASDIQSQINAGTYDPTQQQQNAGSQYQEQTLNPAATPPAYQSAGLSVQPPATQQQDYTIYG